MLTKFSESKHLFAQESRPKANTSGWGRGGAFPRLNKFSHCQGVPKFEQVGGGGLLEGMALFHVAHHRETSHFEQTNTSENMTFLYTA